MTVLETLVQSPLAKALGWALFHSLWEGAVAAISLLVTLSVVRSPRIRYAAACLAMLVIPAGFSATLFRSLPEGSATPTIVIRNIPHAFPAGQGFRELSDRRMAEILPWLTPFWIAGVILFQLRGIASWMSASRLRRKGVCPAPDRWQERLNQLRERLRVRTPVGLLETALGQTPVVVGWMRPVILFPVGLFAAMPTGQVEAVLLHELVHIRRRDYLVNLLQTVMEGFLFYHPAVWWISCVIRTERENCCDDLVVAVHGNAHEYATALTALEENRWAKNEVVLAVTGGVLMKRIRRLLYPKESPRTFLTPVLSAGMLVAVTAMALTAWQSKPAGDAAGDFHQKWLNEEVPYIITDAERNTFNQLQSNSEREIFIEQLWARRNPTPGAVENAFRADCYRRIGYANEHFGSKAGTPGWKTDRGRIYITFGPPDEIDSYPNASATKLPYADWHYRYLENIGNNVAMEFIDTDLSGEFHMAKDPNPGEGRRVAKP
jgi:GWxTD domain-containing protein